MKRLLIIGFFFLGTVAIAAGPKYQYADPKLNDEIANIYSDIKASRLNIMEVDGSPVGKPKTLKFTNGTVTNNGNGSFTITVTGGAGASLSSTNTWTADQLLKGVTISSGITLSSGIVCGTSPGTLGQFLTSGGPGAVCSWRTGGTGDMVLASTQTSTGPKTFTSNGTGNVPITINQNNTTGTGNHAFVINSSGTGIPLYITVQGLPSNGYQNGKGAITLEKLSGVPVPYLVINDSTTDAQLGTGLLEIVSNASTHNDPKLWFRITGADSSPEIRDDANAPNWEMINLSTDNVHGLGKFEPAAIANKGVNLQVNSRAWDNSTFENEAYWVPLSQIGAGLYLAAQTLTNDSGVLSSSDTLAINFTGLNGSSLGLTGPLNPTGSFSYGLPNNSSPLGRIMYGLNNGRGKNNNTRDLDFSGSDFTYTTAVGVTVSTITVNAYIKNASYTIATLNTLAPAAAGVQVYCSNCVAMAICISTGTGVGAWVSPALRTTKCN